MAWGSRDRRSPQSIANNLREVRRLIEPPMTSSERDLAQRMLDDLVEELER